MKKNASILFTGLLVLLLTTGAWADLDPRANIGTCGFTSIEETWEPDASGTLTKRVTYVSQCDTPTAGEETITITTEEDFGSGLVTTEVRQGVRTLVGGIYFTTTEIYDGSMALQGKEEYSYNDKVTNPDMLIQEWDFYNWNGSAYEITGATVKTIEWFAGEEMEVTYIYYDTTPRAEPVIPDDVPILGAAALPALPPVTKSGLGTSSASLGDMYRRVLNTIMVNPNTQHEGELMLAKYGLPEHHNCVPGGLFVAGVLKGDRENDPAGIEGFNGFFTRWVRFSNDVDGNLTALFGWTSDRDLNEPTDDWWQARVRQDASGAIEYIENAHRSGETNEDHYDTYTLLNSMFMIESQTVTDFDWDEGNPGNFFATTTVTNGMAAPVSYTEWTVTVD